MNFLKDHIQHTFCDWQSADDNYRCKGNFGMGIFAYMKHPTNPDQCKVVAAAITEVMREMAVIYTESGKRRKELLQQLQPLYFCTPEGVQVHYEDSPQRERCSNELVVVEMTLGAVDAAGMMMGVLFRQINWLEEAYEQRDFMAWVRKRNEELAVSPDSAYLSPDSAYWETHTI